MNQSISRTASVVSLLIGAVMISFSAPLVRLADVAPSVSGFYRVFFGAIILMVWLGVSKGISWRRGWPGSILLGFFFALDLWFWHRSIIYVSPGISTLLANLQVLVMGAVGIWWFKEPAGWRFAGGVIVALAGLWLLLGQGWAQLSDRYQLGVVFGLLTALAYASYLLTMRRVQQRESLGPVERLFQVSLSCAVIMLAATLVEGDSLTIPSLQSAVYLVLIGLLCQVVGVVMIARGLPGLEASVAGLLLLLQPGLSMVWDLLFFELSISVLQTLGVLLTLLGIYLGATIRQRKNKLGTN